MELYSLLLFSIDLNQLLSSEIELVEDLETFPVMDMVSWSLSWRGRWGEIESHEQPGSREERMACVTEALSVWWDMSYICFYHRF